MIVAFSQQFTLERTPVWTVTGNTLPMDMLNILLVLFLVICGYTDVFHRKIYNKVTYPCMLVGLVLNTAANGVSGLQSSVFGLILGYGLFFLAFLFGGMGGGDVKLMGAIGALQGYPFVVHAIMFSILFGFIGALFTLIMSGRLFRSFLNVARFLVTLVIAQVYKGFQMAALDPAESTKIPYGMACCMGTLVAWLLIGAGIHNM